MMHEMSATPTPPDTAVQAAESSVAVSYDVYVPSMEGTVALVPGAGTQEGWAAVNRFADDALELARQIH